MKFMLHCCFPSYYCDVCLHVMLFPFTVFQNCACWQCSRVLIIVMLHSAFLSNAFSNVKCGRMNSLTDPSVVASLCAWPAFVLDIFEVFFVMYTLDYLYNAEHCLFCIISHFSSVVQFSIFIVLLVD